MFMMSSIPKVQMLLQARFVAEPGPALNMKMSPRSVCRSCSLPLGCRMLSLHSSFWVYIELYILTWKSDLKLTAELEQALGAEMSPTGAVGAAICHRV